MIHIFKQEFAQQVRGISPLNAALDDLKQLEDYGVAELMAAKVAACMALAYERNGQAQAGDYLDNVQGVEEDPGTFAQSLEPGTSTVVPTGYSLKAIQANHPNNGYDSFNKAILKRVASSLGVSYNRLVHDYESVNFSSLKDAAIDEKIYFSDMQGFIIRNWKEREFRYFVEGVAMNSDFTASKLLELKRYHHFLAPKKPYFDIGKEVLAEKAQLEIGIKNPIQIIEENGYDIDEILRGWSQWNSLCNQYGVSFNADKATQVEPVEAQTDDEQLGKARD